jgi:outer membrane protein OmpA-like peptidoglycan-associated protein/tetratricopeptide (TPR) repeat protein
MKAVYSTLIFSVLFSFQAFGQSSYKLNLANLEYSKTHYSLAKPLYEDVLAEDSLNEAVQIKLADCYRRLLDYPRAEKAYAKLIAKKGDSDPELYRYYAEALANNKKYAESKNMYHKYEGMYCGDSRSGNFIETYKDVLALSPDSGSYQVDLAKINSNTSDFSPMYYKKGLVFCSGRHMSAGVRRVFSYDQSAYLDLYYISDTAAAKNSNFTEPLSTQSNSGSSSMLKGIVNDDHSEHTSNDSRTVGFYREPKADTSGNKNVMLFDKKLNSKFHEGPLTFFNGEDSVIFTRNRATSSGNNSESHIKLKLYSANNTEKGWKNIKDLPFNSDHYSVAHPSLSPDNKKLYFVSDMPGGLGGTDVYVSELSNGNWGKPVNMGRPVNTEGNEMFPYVDKTGNLYFSSNGHGGLGGLDIFFYNQTDASAKGPKNLGAPINSSSDDFGIIVDKEKRSGYFSSNRRRGGTDDDIYWFTYNPNPDIKLDGFVLDESKLPLDSSLVIIIKEGDTTITNSMGAFKYILKEGNEYNIIVKKNGFEQLNEIISTVGVKNGKMNVKYSLKKEYFCTLEGNIGNFYSDSLVNDATIKLKNLKNGKTSLYTADADGRFRIGLEENSDYEVIGQAGSNRTSNLVITTWGREKGCVINTNIAFMLRDKDCEERRKKFYIDNIYYDENKYQIPRASKPTVERIVQMMKKHPEVELVISSHTDSKSSMFYNEILSQMRTESIYEYLVTHGVSSKRLIKQYYGEEKLVNRCADSVNCPDELNRLNRRTEFFVLIDKKNITKDCRFIIYDSIPDRLLDKQMLGNVFFRYDKSRITRNGRRNLNYVVSFLKQHPNITVYASAHTDATGSNEYNMDLSAKRLQVCMGYLLKKGLTLDRIKGESFGETKPFNRCKDGVGCSPEEHMINRRTQFSVLIK